MSRMWARFAGLFSSRTMVGMDKAGNRYCARTEEIDGIMKEKRWVVFKGESDPTSIPVEWICWLNGQRKHAPTPEEMAALEARREQVRQNVARLKKEEEEEKARRGTISKAVGAGKVVGTDLKSFIQQFPSDSEGLEIKGASEEAGSIRERTSNEAKTEKKDPFKFRQQPESSEPTGSGESFRPGTWQPPT